MDDGGITISFASGAASVGGLAVGIRLLLDLINRRRSNGSGVGNSEVGQLVALSTAIADVKRDTGEVKTISEKLADRSVEQTTLLRVMVDETKQQTLLLGKIAGKNGRQD